MKNIHIRTVLKRWNINPSSFGARFPARPKRKCYCKKKECPKCFDFKYLNHVYDIHEKHYPFYATFRIMRDVQKEKMRLVMARFARLIREIEKQEFSYSYVIEWEGNNNTHIHFVTSSAYFAKREKLNSEVRRLVRRAVGGGIRRKEIKVDIQRIKDTAADTVHVLGYILGYYDGTSDYVVTSKTPKTKPLKVFAMQFAENRERKISSQ